MNLTALSARGLAILQEVPVGLTVWALADRLWRHRTPNVTAWRDRSSDRRAGAAGRLLSLYENAGWVEGGHGEPWRITDAGKRALAKFQRKESP